MSLRCAQLMEIVMEWPSEEFSQMLMGVLAADFLGSLLLDTVVPKKVLFNLTIW